MKEVFRASSPARVSLYQSVLENAGICCFVLNETSQQSIPGGAIVAFFPLPDFWPTLCVTNDDDYPLAMNLLRDVKDAGAVTSPEWICPQCNETVPGHFGDCWNCGHSANR
jgi:hypothetical protein